MKGRGSLQNLKKNLWNSSFSHIYVEKRALNHINTKRILSNFKNSTIIEIEHYKDVFNRGHQNFTLQKNSPKLILAVKKDNFVYKGAEVCDDFGNSHFYYTSTTMNCIYDCEYCYLQGMYPSSNIVIFVNIEDIFNEVEKLLKKHPVYLCISYDTDILALEGITSFATKWLEFAEKHPDLKIELRTKSANFRMIQDIPVIQNVILAWTLSPTEVIKEYENKTPSLSSRLESINNAIDRGWNVRICFDPLLYIENWREKYGKCIDETFNKIPADDILDISVGVFRVSKDYLKKMRKGRENSLLLSYPFECSSGVCTYTSKHSSDLINFVYRKLLDYVPEEKIYI